MSSTAPAATVLDASNIDFTPESAAQVIRDRGFVILRGLFPEAALDEVCRSAEIWFSRPAIAGVHGYAKVDHPKKLLNPFVLGGCVTQLLVNESVLDVAEAAIGGECILAEAALKFDAPTSYVYFPIHSDFSEGWRKSKSSPLVLSAADMKNVIGIGGALYLHDTDDGAFTYCDGTHQLLSPRGQDLAKYPQQERREILARQVRCDGKRGDLVLFDDRGFHGPDQPSHTSRLVILLDYYRVATFGRTQVSPMPIWSTDIAKMNVRQLRVAGAGATYMVSPLENTQGRFSRNPLYPLIARAIELAYVVRHWKASFRALLRRSNDYQI